MSSNSKTDSKSKWLKESWSKPALPKLSNPDNFVRGDDGCYEIVQSECWGTTLIKIEDPEGQKIPYKDKHAFKLVDDFPRIPKDIWAAWVGLCFQFCEEPEWKPYQHAGSTGGYYGSTDDNEVSIVFLRKQDDLSQWKAVVPLQEVSGGSVAADFTESCDLLTGEKYDVFPPIGYVHVGSSHSHNTMGAFFSGTDDRSELGIPGIHIVVGKIDKKKYTYEYKASIVLMGQRKIIDELSDVVDCTPFSSKFSPVCLEMVSDRSVVVSSSGGGSRMGFGDFGGVHHGPRSRHGSSTRTYHPGALWDNDESEWVYPALEDTDVILLPGDVDIANGFGDIDFSDVDEFLDSSPDCEPYTPYNGDAYEEYKNITAQAYDPDTFSIADLDEGARASISRWIGHEVTEADEEWIKEYLEAVQ